MKKLLLLTMTMAFSTVSMATLLECNVKTMVGSTGEILGENSVVMNTQAYSLSGINQAVVPAIGSEKAAVSAIITTENGEDEALVQLISEEDNKRVNLSNIGTNIATTWDNTGKSYTAICKEL